MADLNKVVDWAENTEVKKWTSKLDEQSEKNFKSLVSKTLSAAKGPVLAWAIALWSQTALANESPKIDNLNLQTISFKAENIEKQNIDFVSYLWDWSKMYVKMQADKRQVFENVYNQILADNGETFIAIKNWKEKEVNTSKWIKAFMRNLCTFLYNLDTKEIDMVEFHSSLIKQIERWKSIWLKVNDDIMYTLYGAKIFAEQVDKMREWFLSNPAEFSEEAKQIKVRIAKLEKEKAGLREEKAGLREEKAKLEAELEVLKVVYNGLKTMNASIE